MIPTGFLPLIFYYICYNRQLREAGTSLVSVSHVLSVSRIHIISLLGILSITLRLSSVDESKGRKIVFICNLICPPISISPPPLLSLSLPPAERSQSQFA